MVLFLYSRSPLVNSAARVSREPWFERLLFPVMFGQIPTKVAQVHDINPESAAVAYLITVESLHLLSGG